MNRRDLIKTTAAAAALPALASGQSALATQPAWKPLLFNADQAQTVTQLVDLIIPATDTPGAKAANVHVWMDKILAAAPRQFQDPILDGLAWLDQRSTVLHGKPFRELAEAQQTALLTQLNEGKEPGSEPGTRFLRLFKGRTSQIYYQTKEGQAELNKNGVPSSYGCVHEPGHSA